MSEELSGVSTPEAAQPLTVEVPGNKVQGLLDNYKEFVATHQIMFGPTLTSDRRRQIGDARKVDAVYTEFFDVLGLTKQAEAISNEVRDADEEKQEGLSAWVTARRDERENRKREERHGKDTEEDKG